MKSSIRAALIYAVSLLLTFALEHAAEVFFRGDQESHDKTAIETILTAATAGYQRFLTLGYRQPRAHYVRLVMLDPRKEPNGLMWNLCDKRVMYAKVIRRIVAAAPASIVIDATFGPDKCPEGDSRTADLVDAVQTAVAQDVPVAIGLKALTTEEMELPKNEQTLSETELLAQPSLNFVTNDSRFDYGHVRLNADLRKIPLNWPTFFRVEDARSKVPPIPFPGLAYVAARRYDSLLVVQPRMERLLGNQRHPFSSFIREDQFPTYEALDLVCGKYQTPPQIDWKNCEPGEYGKAALRGHIVVIGERTDQEFRDSEVGRVPGVVLQANYIESLLDDRYFLPIATWIQILFSFVVFGLVEFVFRSQKRKPALAFVYTLGGIAFVWLASWVLLVVSARLLVLWVPGLFALIGKYVDLKLKGEESK
jgi:hypothetical protein